MKNLESQIRQYEDEGYVKLSECKNANLAHQLFASISKNLNDKNLIPGFRSKTGSPKQYIDILSKYKNEILDILPLEKINALARGIYGSRRYAYITHSKLSIKFPFTESEWLPHQDNGYKPLANKDARYGFAIMLFLEDVNELNGCLHVYAGSHKLGPLPHKKIVDDKESGDYQLMLDMDYSRFVDKSVFGAAGDCVMFDNNTVHYSMGSRTNSNRVAIIFEVALVDKVDLDDYGRRPFLLYGKLSFRDNLALALKRLTDNRKYFYYLSRFTRLKKIYRFLFFKY